MTVEMDDDPILALPAADVLIPGIPAHLVMPLRHWTERVFDRRHPLAQIRTQAVCLRLGITPHQGDYLNGLKRQPDRELLKIVQATLAIIELDEEDLANLEQIFVLGRSIYELQRYDMRPRIGRRMPAGVTAVVDRARHDAPTQAAAHLGNAIRAAYDLEPDPNKAYLESVMAVEAVICPLVEPNSTRASLSTTVRNLENDMNSSAPAWMLQWGGPKGQPAQMVRLTSMLQLLFQAHHRHGGAVTMSQSQEEAEWSVHLAAALVQMISTGLLRKI
ncbi:hypothetical protein Cs7R123_49420 [Catellatospora sp. TT07R-123]|uniref:hypothetical protein n=1 Tax=Catellatospora sp. TT07R-123 TaxID=2733863 RepID=UPI001B1E4C10|nr:hypothetical protein [Catellatospora sp. TT07R-123]GHJ47600.1 hypothetical protein Cs7R123_49420 [Catellatospora sp. TT07R-123]